MVDPTRGHSSRPNGRRQAIALDPIEDPPGDAAKHPVPRAARQRGLVLVGLFKYSKVVFFTALGVGALRLIHMDPGVLAARFIQWAHDWAHLDSEGRMASLVMDRAEQITHHQLRQGALFAFLYAGLCMVEGTGLLMEKRWAEYLTVVLTAMALPWEAFELVTHFALYKVALTVVNLVVLLYLLSVLKRKGLFEKASA